MRDQGIWSIGFGRWNGVHVRLHMFFMLFAAFTIYLGWLDLEGPGWSGPLLVCLLLISVGFHELGHLWAFRRLAAVILLALQIQAQKRVAKFLKPKKCDSRP